MENALSFVSQQFKHGMCYPVWMDDDDMVVLSRKELASARGVSAMSALLSDNSLAEGDLALIQKVETKRRSALKASAVKAKRVDAVESRDAWADVEQERIMPPNSSGRDNDGAVQADLDDVITKIIKQRNELLQANMESEEEITRLKLENENLKNLNAIGKRLTNNQREQLTQLKIQSAKDRMANKEALGERDTKIAKIEGAISKLRNQSLDAKYALEDGIFWSASRKEEQHGEPVVVKAEDERPAPVIEKSKDVLDSVFDWTVGR